MIYFYFSAIFFNGHIHTFPQLGKTKLIKINFSNVKCHNIDQGPSMGQVSNIGQVPGISKARASVKYLVSSVKIPNIGQVSRIDLVSTAKNGFVLTKQYYQANCIPASFD